MGQWSGPAAKLIIDGHPIQLSVPKEGTFGFVYTLNVVNNAPNAENAYKFLHDRIQQAAYGIDGLEKSNFDQGRLTTEVRRAMSGRRVSV